MAYRKLMKNVDLNRARMNIATKQENKNDVLYSKFANLLPIVYQGPTDRMAKYGIFDNMEQDTTINQALDILTNYTSQDESGEPFYLDYPTSNPLTDNQIMILEKKFDEWMRINSIKKRIFSIMRDILKYGDCVLIRDPETFILNKVNIYDVVGITANNDKTPKEYLIKNVDLNIPLSLATTADMNSSSLNMINTMNVSSNTNNVNTQQFSGGNNPNGSTENTVVPIDAENVVHFTMNVDDNTIYPFGRSVLETIYKVYIQKMLMQDCILMHRIDNAVEKLVFKIPMGGIPAYMRRTYLERQKNEYSQRRLPSKEGSSPFNTIDVAYNSIPFNENYWLPVDDNGQSPSIDKLTASKELGQINDLVYFNNEEIRGLKLPSGWVPYGPTDGNRTVPTSKKEIYVQEHQFLLYCIRIQNTLEESWDREFKYYLAQNGINIENTSFFVKYHSPSNITEITKQEIDSQRLQNCQTAQGIKGMSIQMTLKHYLGWTDEEFNENQKYLLQEKQEQLKSKNAFIPEEDTDQIPGLKTVGIDDIPDEYLQDIQTSVAPESSPMGNEMGGNPMGGDMSGGEMGGMPENGMGM